MKKLLASLLLVAAGNLWALDATEKRYVDMITQGSMASVKQAAREIHDTKYTSTAVLDYLAETLLQKYAAAAPGDIDTLAWTCRALGASGNPRYFDTLSEVANSNAHKKLRKYADSALDDLGEKGTATQYKRGKVSMKAGAGSSPVNSAGKSTSAGGKGSLSDVKAGMSMAQAYDLVGEPNTSTGHITGKAWIPFNFKGADTARLYALYKGKGRIIFSNRSHYDQSWKVYEVQIDANESGYP